MLTNSLTVQILQSFCICSIFFSIVFVYIELRSNFHRSFLYFGITLFLLALFSGIDLWMQPGAFSAFWTNVQHIIFCFIPPFMFRYVTLLKGRVRHTFWKYYLSAASLISLGFLTDIMFHSEKGPVPTPLYYAIFMPFFLFSVGYLLYLIFERRSGYPMEVKIRIVHLFAFGFLALCGIGDLLHLLLLLKINPLFISSTSVGIVMVSILLLYLFTERMLGVIAERQNMLLQLQSAYKELDEARTLSELGKSTAIINHEIRNYAFAISAVAELVKAKGGLNEKYQKKVEQIILSVNHLIEFSNDILDLVKARIIKDKKPLDLCGVVRRSIENHFESRREAFSLSGMEGEAVIHGDQHKLEHVFVNIFKNAFEARASAISVKMVPSRFVKLLTIEDDGVGCDGEAVKKLFQTFNTANKHNGTGLGLSISRSIVESHGGHISVYSKNVLGEGHHGLKFIIALPLFGESGTSPVTADHQIILVKEGIDSIESLITTFNNVGFGPHIVESVAKFSSEHFAPDKVVVLGCPDAIAEITGLRQSYRCYALTDLDGCIRVTGGGVSPYDGHFDEEYIVSHLDETAGN